MVTVHNSDIFLGALSIDQILQFGCIQNVLMYQMPHMVEFPESPFITVTDCILSFQS